MYFMHSLKLIQNSSEVMFYCVACFYVKHIVSALCRKCAIKIKLTWLDTNRYNKYKCMHIYIHTGGFCQSPWHTGLQSSTRQILTKCMQAPYPILVYGQWTANSKSGVQSSVYLYFRSTPKIMPDSIGKGVFGQASCTKDQSKKCIVVLNWASIYRGALSSKVDR